MTYCHEMLIAKAAVAVATKPVHTRCCIQQCCRQEPVHHCCTGSPKSPNAQAVKAGGSNPILLSAHSLQHCEHKLHSAYVSMLWALLHSPSHCHTVRSHSAYTAQGQHQAPAGTACRNSLQETFSLRHTTKDPLASLHMQHTKQPCTPVYPLACAAAAADCFENGHTPLLKHHASCRSRSRHHLCT